MSRTHKIQRSRQAHATSKLWRVAFNSSRKLGHTDEQASQEAHAILMETERLAQESRELHRTSGVRYGNQRKMRARADVVERRADRKRDPDPILDADGDLGLSDRPPSPSRRRGPRWT